MSNIEVVAVGDVVVIERAMFRGRFIVSGFKWTDTPDDRVYAYLVHETNPRENCHVLVSNVTSAENLIEVDYNEDFVWGEHFRYWCDVHDGRRLS